MSGDAARPVRAVAVTGATGFLGLALVRALLAADIRVVALTRPSTDPRRLPSDDRVSHVGHVHLSDPGLAAALEAQQVDALVHLGWAGVAGSRRGATDHVGENVPAVVASVRLAADAGCRYWLGAGSQAEYGPSPELLSESSPLRPATDYGIAKVAAAGAAHATGGALGVTTGWARVFSLYGPGDHAETVLSYATRSLLDGEAPALGPCTHDWDLLHVDDGAQALLTLIRHAAPGPYNVASGTARPLRDAIELVAAAVGGPARPHYRDAPSSTPLRASIDRIAQLEGWTAPRSLEQGIPHLVAHLRQSGEIVPTGART